MPGTEVKRVIGTAIRASSLAPIGTVVTKPVLIVAAARSRVANRFQAAPGRVIGLGQLRGGAILVFQIAKNQYGVRMKSKDEVQCLPHMAGAARPGAAIEVARRRVACDITSGGDD